MAWYAALAGCPETQPTSTAILYESDRRAHDVAVERSYVLPLSASDARRCEPTQPTGVGFDLDYNGRALALLVATLPATHDVTSFAMRREAIAVMKSTAQSLASNREVLVMGDLGTVGHPEPDATSGDQEIDRLSEELLDAELWLATSERTCTRYTTGTPQRVDHLATEHPTQPLQIDGACRVTECASYESGTSGLERIEGHCPMWLDLSERL